MQCPLLGMRQHVLLQLVPIDVPLFAHCARVLPIRPRRMICQTVCLEAVMASESFQANRALQWILSGVHQHVIL